MKHFILFLILFPLFVNAQKYSNREQNFPKKPNNYVTDDAKILTPEEEDKLNTKLRIFEDSTSNQLFIYTANSLEFKNLEDYSREIFNSWGIGQKEKNNGILIAIFTEDHKFRIQIGYGLEASLPSTLTKQIQDDEMRPLFKEKDYYGGIDSGVDKLIYYSKHEFKPTGLYEELLPKLFVPAGISYLISILFYVVNLNSIKNWKNQSKRRKKNILICTLFLIIPFLGTLLLIWLCMVLDKKQSQYDYETDVEYQRRMQREKESSNNNDTNDNFSGGGGGSSDTGGSSSNW